MGPAAQRSLGGNAPFPVCPAREAHAIKADLRSSAARIENSTQQTVAGGLDDAAKVRGDFRLTWS